MELISLDLLHATVRVATPILLAAVGRSFNGLTGIVNVALEGTMLIGSFAAVVFSYLFENAWLGVTAGIAAGMLTNLIFAWVNQDLDADERVTAMAINVLALGLTIYLLRSIFGVMGAFSSPRIKGLGLVDLPWLGAIPVLGPILNKQSVITYLSLLSVIVAYVVIKKTPFGQRLRSVGHNPEAAAAVGINVKRYRYIGFMISGIGCGLAGAFLSLSYLTMFTENMTGGRGFIAVAANILGQNHPLGILGASLLFGYADVLAVNLQMRSDAIPAQIPLMIPYILTLIVLVISVRRPRGSRKPARWGKRAATKTEKAA